MLYFNIFLSKKQFFKRIFKSAMNQVTRRSAMRAYSLKLIIIIALPLQTVAKPMYANRSTSEQASTDKNTRLVKEAHNQGVKQREFSLSTASQKKLLENMVWIEGGSFEMGTDAENARKRETPAHQVKVEGFFLSKFEVTQTLFEEVMGWNYSYFQCKQCPMNNISWSNMQLFIERLNAITGKSFRLPNEIEWEYAAKGGQASKGYLYSGSNNIADVAWYSENSNNKSHPVGQKLSNELGLFDMTGNLWEFCQDTMDKNAYTITEEQLEFLAAMDSKAMPRSKRIKSMKVIRGGGYEFPAEESEVFRRDGATNNVRMPDIGFRLAMNK